MKWTLSKMTEWWVHTQNLILVDSSFWIGYIDSESNDYGEFLNKYSDKTFLIPYPSLAEFMNDKLLKNSKGFEKIIKFFTNKKNIEYYKYNLTECERDFFINEFLGSKLKIKEKGIPNFIDIIIGKIIEDTNAPFVFVTKNSSDFFKFTNKHRLNCHVLDFGKKERIQ